MLAAPRSAGVDGVPAAMLSNDGQTHACHGARGEAGVDHDRFAFLVALAVRPTVGVAHHRTGR